MTGAGPDPRESHLYRVFLDGGTPVRVSEGAGHHTATFARDHGAHVYGFDLNDGHQGKQVRSRNGQLLAEVPSVAAKPPVSPGVELTRVGAGPVFDASVVRPRDLQPRRKYPVILDVYAGPGTSMADGIPGRHLWSQWLADHGFIVVSLDGRGTPGRGHDWERVIKGNLIDVALEDQVAGLRALGAKYPDLDMKRVGVVGWEDYDTHYAERYMDLPSANPEGYRKANVLTYASELERPLLPIHGLTDDNVYFLQTLELAGALFAAGRQYDLLPLVGTHLVYEPTVQMRLQSRITDFLERNLTGTR